MCLCGWDLPVPQLGWRIENVAILVVIAINEDGHCEVLGAAEGVKEDKASWISFLQWLCGRGPDGNSALMLVCARLRHVASI